MAQETLGYCYMNGYYNAGIDEKKGIEWYEKAAEQGDAYIAVTLGAMYQYGDHVDPDIEKAIYWYEKGLDAYRSGFQWDRMRDNSIKELDMTFIQDMTEYLRQPGQTSADTLYQLAEYCNPGLLNVGIWTEHIDAAKAASFYKHAALYGNAKAMEKLKYLDRKWYETHQGGFVEEPARKESPAAVTEPAAKAPADDTDAIKLCIIGAEHTEKTTLTSAITIVAHERIGDNPPGLDPSDVGLVDPGLTERITFKMIGGTKFADQEWICFHTDNRTYQLACWPDKLQGKDVIVVEMADCDGAILMVDARDGVLDRTRKLARLAIDVAGIPVVAIILDNCDIVDDRELLEIEEMEADEVLTYFDCEPVPIFRMSACQACKDPLCNDRDLLPSGDTLMEFFSYLDGFDFSAAKAVVNAGCDFSSMPRRECDLLVSAYYLRTDEGGSEEPLINEGYGEFVIGTAGMSGNILLENAYLKLKDAVVVNGDHFRAYVFLDETLDVRLGQKFGYFVDEKLVATGVITGLDDDSHTNT